MTPSLGRSSLPATDNLKRPEDMPCIQRQIAETAQNPMRSDVTFGFLLSRYALGRMMLHFGCLVRGGQWRFHLAGIRRELRRSLEQSQ